MYHILHIKNVSKCETTHNINTTIVGSTSISTRTATNIRIEKLTATTSVCVCVCERGRESVSQTDRGYETLKRKFLVFVVTRADSRFFLYAFVLLQLLSGELRFEEKMSPFLAFTVTVTKYKCTHNVAIVRHGTAKIETRPRQMSGDYTQKKKIVSLSLKWEPITINWCLGPECLPLEHFFLFYFPYLNVNCSSLICFMPIKK